MTTLAIIGGGIVGRSVLYSLRKTPQRFDRIILFETDLFATPCSLNSTAIVSPRGVSGGVSPLGDLLCQGYERFARHVHEDGPSGVTTGPQFTGATVKLEQFQKRYPSGSEVLRVGELELKRPTYFAREEAFLIHPPEYLAWLLDESCRCLPIEKYNDLVIGLERADVITLSTQRGERFSCDEVILCTGAATRFWRQLFPEGRLHSARPVQGAYFEFTGITGFGSSFSFTIDGDNLIYDAQRKTLLLGSTTADRTYELAHEAELLAVHERLSEKLSLKLPAPGTGTIRVGLREKAPRREPYCERDRNLAALGGFYKNGYTLSLLMAEKL